MKIVREGVAPNKYWWVDLEFTCDMCGTVFILAKSDLEFVRIRKEKTYLFAEYECPLCLDTASIGIPLNSHQPFSARFSPVAREDTFLTDRT